MWDQYSLSSLKRGVRNPRLLALECNRLFYTRGRRWRYNHNGSNILDEDWDTVIILDACRYDSFADHHTLPGTLEKRTSLGANTYEWLRGTFNNKILHDTVYITANPQLHRVNENIYDIDDKIDVSFHDIINVWQDGWDDQARTVRPEQVAEAARAALSRYPRKRHIIHFMQPHYPFIGPTGREYFDIDRLNFNWHSFPDIPEHLVEKAYRENLEIVLPVVADLMDDLDGRTVVTADHGEALGERDRPLPTKLFAHRLGHYAKVLTQVPWLVHEKDERREIRADPPVMSNKDIDENVVSERLRNLGYQS